MTGCERALEAMSERMDNALAAADCIELKRHLASCASCRARETGIAELRGLLRRLEGVSLRPAETVALNVRAAVEGTALPDPEPARPEASGRRSMVMPALLGTSIGLLLAIPIAIVVVRHGSRRPAPRPAAPVVAAAPVAPSRESAGVERNPPRTETGNPAPEPAVEAPAEHQPAEPEPPPVMPPAPDPPSAADPEPEPLPPTPQPDREAPPKPIPLPGPLEGHTDTPKKFSGRVIIITTSGPMVEDFKKVFEDFPGKVKFGHEDLPGLHRVQIAAWFNGPDSRDLKEFHAKFKEFQEKYAEDFDSMDWKMDD